MKVEKKDLVILILLFSLSALFYVENSTSFLATSDEVLNFYAPQKLIQNGNVDIYNPLNAKYNTCVFSTYLTAFKNSSSAYPASFSGTIIFYYIFMLLFGENVYFFMNALFAAFSVAIMYLIIINLLNSKYLGIIGSLVLFTTPAFIKVSTGYYNIIPTTTFFLLSFLFLLTSTRKKGYVYSGIFFSLAIFIRPPEALFLLPFLVFIYLESASVKNFFYFLAPIFVGVIISLLMNLYLFDSLFFIPHAFNTNYPCINDINIGNNNFISTILEFFTNGFSIQNILFHIRYFIKSDFAYLFLPVSLVGLLLFLKRRKSISIFIFLVFLVIVLFYGHNSDNYYGYGVQSLQSSFVRYLLPAYILLPIGFVYSIKTLLNIKSLKNKRKFVIPILGLFVLSTLSFAITFEPYGLNYNKNQDNSLINLQNKIMNITEPDSIIIAGYYTSKLVSLNRPNTITYSRTFANKDMPHDVIFQDIKRIVKAELNNGNKVYFIGQKSYGDDIDMYNLLKDDFKIEKLDEGFSIEIYTVNLNKYANN